MKRQLLSVLVCFTFCALPALGGGAKDLLAQVRKAYTASPSFTLAFTQTYAPAGFPEVKPEKGTLVLAAPNKARFDYAGAEGKVFSFDGTAARQYVAADTQMVVKNLTAEEKARLPLVFLESTEALLARFDAAGSGSEVTLTPKTKGSLSKITLGVSPQGDVSKLVVLDADGNRTTFTFSEKKPGPARPLSDFALTPPAGTKILTE